MTDMNLLRKQYTRITSAGYEPKKAGNRGWVRGKKISNTPVKSEWVDMFYNGQKQGSTYIPVGSMKKRLGKGWTGESTRHSMASYGIKTGNKKNTYFYSNKVKTINSKNGGFAKIKYNMKVSKKQVGL